MVTPHRPAAATEGLLAALVGRSERASRYWSSNLPRDVPVTAWRKPSWHHLCRRFQGVGFHEQALPFVTLAGTAEADHYCGQPARSMRLPGAFGVAGWKEDEVVEMGAAQAMRLVVLHEEQVVTGRGAG